jgi:hypothetical protein
MATRKKVVDMQKIMEIYQKAGTPGDPHKALARLEGSWETRSRGWMEPGKPPVESRGTCEQKMVLDGHFLQQTYTGDMMGMPYTGLCLLGYDNHTKQYQSIWVDTMSTGLYFFEGTGSKAGRTIKQVSHYDDPVHGPSVWRTVTRIKDDRTIDFEMFLAPKGKKETKMMEMTITRKAVAVPKAA